MSLIQLASPAEASPLRQPNKRVRCAPRSCRASLQTAPRVPSPHLVYYGRAPSDGAPFSFRPWRNALSRRTAPQLLEAPRTPKKALLRRDHDTPCGVSRNRRRQLTELSPPI